MQLTELRGLVATDQIREGLLKTSAEGWIVALEDMEGHQFPLTDRGGHAKYYHSLDSATNVLRELGIARIQVVEDF